MNILEKHEQALSKANIYYHKFLKRYREGEKVLYIFCEGEEDVGYYANAIHQNFLNLSMVKYNVGGKNNVIAINEYFDWERFDKNQILFFVDRDMSYWLETYKQLKDNIYVTDEYSFENNIVDVKYFIAFLEELCGFTHATEEELMNISNFYNEKWHVFKLNAQYIMSALAISLKYRNEHLAKKFEHKELIKIRREEVWVKVYNGKTLREYVDEIFKIEPAYQSEIELLIERFNQEPNQYAVRGKWALSFLVKMLNYIVQERKTYAPSLYSGEMDNPGCLWDMKEEQAVLVLSPRIPICKTLYDFCNVHITEYLASLGEEV